MKKYLRSLMFDALLALVLLWGLVSMTTTAFLLPWQTARKPTNRNCRREAAARRLFA